MDITSRFPKRICIWRRADYERKQTLVNAERFTSPELKEYERKILAADERIAEIECRLFVELRSGVAAHAARLRVTASAIAQLDVLTAFAKLAAERGYARPEFNSTGELLIVEGRHPVIEELLRQRGERFVPNDLYLESQRQQLLLITGPNMGGKSTYLRQAALIVLMAQMGCFVPARQAKLPITDRIFTRIGASDNLARGRSTFLVEMSEVAAILHHATPASLVLLDEVGRGTSTFDGLVDCVGGGGTSAEAHRSANAFCDALSRVDGAGGAVDGGEERACVGERDAERNCVSCGAWNRGARTKVMELKWRGWRDCRAA